MIFKCDAFYLHGALPISLRDGINGTALDVALFIEVGVRKVGGDRGGDRDAVFEVVGGFRQSRVAIIVKGDGGAHLGSAVSEFGGVLNGTCLEVALFIEVA